MVAAGLAIGVGGMAVMDRDETASYRPHPPSIAQFSFPLVEPEGPQPVADVVPGLEVEPATARAAVAAFQERLADGRPTDAYPLLDEASRRRYPSLASWTRAQADRATPLTFSVGAARPSPDRPGAFEVDLAATHESSLDATRGLVPARSTSVWLARLENDTWRVFADPLTFRPVLPPDAAATDAVQGWVGALAACDTTVAVQPAGPPEPLRPRGPRPRPVRAEGNLDGRRAGRPRPHPRRAGPSSPLSAPRSARGPGSCPCRARTAGSSPPSPQWARAGGSWASPSTPPDIHHHQARGVSV